VLTRETSSDSPISGPRPIDGLQPHIGAKSNMTPARQAQVQGTYLLLQHFGIRTALHRVVWNAAIFGCTSTFLILMNPVWLYTQCMLVLVTYINDCALPAYLPSA
jgi:hypothetical protein